MYLLISAPGKDPFVLPAFSSIPFWFETSLIICEGNLEEENALL